MSVSKTATAARRAAVTRANARLRVLLPDDAERKLYADAVDRYADACATAARIKAEWEQAGCPVEAEGSMGQPIPHPLVKMIADAETLAAKFATAVGLDLAGKVTNRQSAGGRPKGATSAPDRPSTAEPARLTRVK